MEQKYFDELMLVLDDALQPDHFRDEPPQEVMEKMEEDFDEWFVWRQRRRQTVHIAAVSLVLYLTCTMLTLGVLRMFQPQRQYRACMSNMVYDADAGAEHITEIFFS